MKRLEDLDYSTVPGISGSIRILIKSLIRKFYINPKLRLKSHIINRRFNRTRKTIETFISKSDTRIPKIIHYIWVGGNTKPDSVYKCIESWKKYCPDYLIIEWNEKNYDISVNRYTREAYKSKKWAFVTDYMRLDILDRFGGVYVDSDVEILKNIDKFLEKPAFTSFEIGNPDFILMPTGIIGAIAGNNWIRYLKTYYNNERGFILPDGSFDNTPNTNIITDMTKAKYRIKINNKLQEKSDFTIYPNDFFCPKSWSTGEINLTKNSHTIHHFAGSWQKD